MFRFYGGKRGAAAAYAPPRHDTIIEPFAGARVARRTARHAVRRDQARIAGHLGQRTRAHRAEWGKWIDNEVVVLQENCLAEDPPDHYGWHICQTVIDEYNSTGTVTERTWKRFREWLTGPVQ